MEPNNSPSPAADLAVATAATDLAATSLPAINPHSLALDKLDLDGTITDLTEEKVSTLEISVTLPSQLAAHQRLAEAKNQVSSFVQSLKTNANLLTTKDFDYWREYVEETGRQANQLLVESKVEEAEQKVQELVSHLKSLDDFFRHEKSQGLVATHATTGIRIYVDQAKGSVWFVTPDEQAFDYKTKEAAIKDLVQCLNGDISISDTRYQDRSDSGATHLMGCRLDELRLGSGDKFTIRTHLRSPIQNIAENLPPSSNFTQTDVSFSLADLLNTAPQGPNPVETRPPTRIIDGPEDYVHPVLDALAEHGIAAPPSDPAMRRWSEGLDRSTRRYVGEVYDRASRRARSRATAEATPEATTEGSIPKSTTEATTESITPETTTEARAESTTRTSPEATSRTAPETNTSRGSNPTRTPATTESAPKSQTWMGRNLPTAESIASRTGRAFQNPTVQNATVLTGLVAFHNSVAGDYRPDAQHSVMPKLTRLLFGELADDKLDALGIINVQGSTKELGATRAWIYDTASTVGDIGVAFGTLKAAELALNSRLVLPALQRVGMASIARLPAGTLRFGGRLLGVAYAPVAGYSYTADGTFIHDKSRFLGMDKAERAGVFAPIEGGVAGALVGGPFAPITAVGGAFISTGTATYGAFKALGDQIDQQKVSWQERGVRETIERAQQGWLKGDSEPSNPLTEVARNYIDQMAKIDFMSRILVMKQQNRLGSDFPIHADNWAENWENIDAILSEIRDHKQGTTYYFGSPLDDYSSQERQDLVDTFEYVFENQNGTKITAETLYQRGILIERRSTDTTTAWQAFWDTASDGGKILTTDEVTRIARDFESQFGLMERQLRAMPTTDPNFTSAKEQLAADEVAFLKKRFPLMAQVLADTEARNIFEARTSLVDSAGVPSGTSPILESVAGRQLVGFYDDSAALQTELAALSTALKDPEFQKTILGLVSDQNRIILQRHFEAKIPQDVLNDEQLNPILMQAYESMRTQQIQTEALSPDASK